jgi:hypothetical protein
MGITARDPLDRYLEKVDRRGPDDCWEWTAARFDKGYGAFRLGDKQMKAHRFGYEAQVGPIPEGQYVLHRCDNPPCQNPAHWFLGTHKDNAVDRQSKGRGAIGERNGGRVVARYAAGTIREMRLAALAGEKQADIAARFGTDQAYVSQVVRGEAWAHTDLDLPRLGNQQNRIKVTREVVERVLNADLQAWGSQKALADELGISTRAVRLIRAGYQPKHMPT